MFYSYNLSKLIIFPYPSDYDSLFLMELSRSLNHIKVKCSFKELAICEINFSLTMFWIILELSFITNPFIGNPCKILIIKGILEVLRSIIIDGSSTIETTILPKTSISYTLIWVKHLSISSHFIILPLSFIITTIVKL